MRKLSLPLALLLLVPCVLSSGPAHAGLVFDIARDLDVRSVQRVRPSAAGLVVETQGAARTLPLSWQRQQQLVAWAERYQGGLVVVSVDGALVPNAGSYGPPSAPPALLYALFAMDGFASGLGCGGYQTTSHPLCALHRDDRGFPEHEQARLLDPADQRPEAFAFRRLAARYPKAPRCVGELTLRVRPARGPWPLQLEVNSWLHPQTTLWYRDKDAPSPRDEVAARLPYRALKQDLEGRWERYRAAFPTLDELSALTEGLALLHALRQQRPALWQALRQQLAGPPPAALPPRRESSPSARCPQAARPSTTRSFSATAAAWIGEHVETSAEANLALGLLDAAADPILRLMGEDLSDLPQETWLEEIEALAQQDRRLLAKLRLYQLLTQPSPEALCQDEEGINELFALLREAPLASFRLRARALNTLEKRLAQCRKPEMDVRSGEDDKSPAPGKEAAPAEAEKAAPAEAEKAEKAAAAKAERDARREAARTLQTIRDNLAWESEQLLRDFITQARAACTAQAGPPDDLSPWESLSQDVYSVGLLPRAGRLSHRSLYPQVAELVACVHHRRALAPQTGRALAYRHTHLRYLKELLRTVPNRAQVEGYIKDIAASLQLAEW